MSKVNLPPRVYLIDDDSIMLGLMQGLVQPLNVEAVCFSSAEAFLQAYQPGPCECVVSDMRMPGVSGLQLQMSIQRQHPIPPPLIIVTGYAEVSAAVEAMKQGAFDFVEKPIQGHQFLEKIQAALTLSREAAEALGLSVRTVENHRARLMEKLRVRSALDLVREFMSADV